jgi:hypothetical protein
MVRSFVQAGFLGDFCEFLYCDNSHANHLDGYTGCNHFLRTARGKYLILCHQDILLSFDGLEQLESIIKDMQSSTPDWAVLGNAGGADLGEKAIRIAHANQKKHSSSIFPFRVLSLDENFLVVRQAANLSVSLDLHGFHFYGTDLCQNAISLGFSTWAVDFLVLHKSTGTYNRSFFECYKAIRGKYRRTLSNGYIQTTCAVIPTGTSWWCTKRALYVTLRDLQKLELDNACLAPQIDELRNELGTWSFVIQTVFYKIVSPCYNLKRSLKIRFFKSKTRFRQGKT